MAAPRPSGRSYLVVVDDDTPEYAEIYSSVYGWQDIFSTATNVAACVDMATLLNHGDAPRIIDECGPDNRWGPIPAKAKARHHAAAVSSS